MVLDSLQEVMFVFPVFCVNQILQIRCSSENIRSITDLVDPEDDCTTITAVHDRIDKESTARRKELERAHANLKGTSTSPTPVPLSIATSRFRSSHGMHPTQPSHVSSTPPARPLRVPPACPPPNATRETSTTSTAHECPSPRH